MKKKYQRKPEVVDAVQYTGPSRMSKEPDERTWRLNGLIMWATGLVAPFWWRPYLSGTMFHYLKSMDWIVTHENGEIELLEDAEFKNKYEERGE